MVDKPVYTGPITTFGLGHVAPTTFECSAEVNWLVPSLQ